MATRLNPYLNFDGNAKEAMEFYHSVLGGELTSSTFGEYGQNEGNMADRIMHAQLESADMTLMASDTWEGADDSPKATSVSLSLSGPDADDLRGYWEKLSDGGTVTIPLEKQMWGDEFGMLTDKFGMNWMVNIVAAGSAE